MAATFEYEVAVVSVASIEPSFGPPAGGTPIAVIGRGFQDGATIDLDGVPATDVVFVSASRLTAVTPAHADGDVDVTVTNPDTGTDTRSNGFAYQTVIPQRYMTYRTPGGAAASALRLVNREPTIRQQLGQPAMATFTTDSEPAGEQSATFVVNGQELFLGTITRKLERTDGRLRQQCWDCEAVDGAHQLSRRHPTGSWHDISATSVLTSVMAAVGSDFSLVVEAALPNVTVLLDGTLDCWAVITQVCEKAGAKCVLFGRTLRVFSTASGWDPPGAVTEGNPDLIHEEEAAVSIEWDYTGIINAATVRGAKDIKATIENGASIAQYGRSEIFINDNTLETQPAVVARATQALVGVTQPVKAVHYATRDLKTHVGKSVAIAISKPAISGTFVIQAVEISELELLNATPATNPRFTVTAVPPEVPMRRSGIEGALETVIDLAADQHKQPKLDGAVQSAPGGQTVIPDNSIPAGKLAGCIPGSALLPKTISSSQLADTGVTPGTHGDSIHLVAFDVDAAGRITGTTVDPVPVAKTDGSQPWTGDQAFGGHALTGLADPVDPQDASTKAYVDAAVAAVTLPPPTTYFEPLTNGDPTAPEIFFDSFGDVVMVEVPL